jgi:hypothetical protein
MTASVGGSTAASTLTVIDLVPSGPPAERTVADDPSSRGGGERPSSFDDHVRAAMAQSPQSPRERADAASSPPSGPDAGTVEEGDVAAETEPRSPRPPKRPVTADEVVVELMVLGWAHASPTPAIPTNAAATGAPVATTGEPGTTASSGFPDVGYLRSGGEAVPGAASTSGAPADAQGAVDPSPPSIAGDAVQSGPSTGATASFVTSNLDEGTDRFTPDDSGMGLPRAGATAFVSATVPRDPDTPAAVSSATTAPPTSRPASSVTVTAPVVTPVAPVGRAASVARRSEALVAAPASDPLPDRPAVGSGPGGRVGPEVLAAAVIAPLSQPAAVTTTAEAAGVMPAEAADVNAAPVGAEVPPGSSGFTATPTVTPTATPTGEGASVVGAPAADASSSNDRAGSAEAPAPGASAIHLRADHQSLRGTGTEVTAPVAGSPAEPREEVVADGTASPGDTVADPSVASPVVAAAGRAEAAPSTSIDTARRVGQQNAAPGHEQQVVRVIAPLRGREGSHQVTLALRPAELGQVVADIRFDRGAVHLTITSEHGETADLLRRGASSLRSALADAGLTVASIDVGERVRGASGSHPSDRPGTDPGAARPDPSGSGAAGGGSTGMHGGDDSRRGRAQQPGTVPPGPAGPGMAPAARRPAFARAAVQAPDRLDLVV